MAVRAGINGVQRELSGVYTCTEGVNRKLSNWQGCVGGVNRELLKKPIQYQVDIQKVEWQPYTESGGPGITWSINWSWASGGAWGETALHLVPSMSSIFGWDLNVYGAFDQSLAGKTIDFVVLTGGGLEGVLVQLLNESKGMTEAWQVTGRTENGIGFFSATLPEGQNDWLMSFHESVFSPNNPYINVYMSVDGNDIIGG